jgi:hypothetical protein
LSTKKMELLDFDAKYYNVNDDVLPNQSIERCHPSKTGVRVFVQFTTPTNAALALQRSGEILPINVATTTLQQQDASSIDPFQSTFGVLIAITPVPQSVAVSMIQVVGINITNHRNDQPIQKILESIVNQIDPNISLVLWNQLIDELSLNVVMLEGTPDAALPGSSISSVLQNLRKYGCCGSSSTKNLPLSEPDIQLLQQDRLLLQQEMDRIMTVNSIKGEHKDDDYFMIIPFLSISHCDTAANLYRWNNGIVPYHQNHKLQGMKDTFVCNDSSLIISGRNSCCPVVLHFTDQYIQRLQTLMDHIKGTITISQRWGVTHHRKDSP